MIVRQKHIWNSKDFSKLRHARVLEEGQWLAEWLNDSSSPDDGKSRISNMIYLLGQMERGRLSLIHNPTPGNVGNLVRLESKLRDITARYVTHPTFILWPHPARPEAIPSTQIRIYHTFNFAERGQISTDEAQALRAIEDLVYAGLFLDRLKTCQVCARWVFHKKTGGKTCGSRRCKNYYYESKPSRQQRKRQNSHDNYHKAKARDQRNLERVRKGSTK